MKLLICVPSLDFMHVDFVRSLTKLICQLNAEHIKFDVEIFSGTLVYVARDRLAAKAVQEEYTHTLWFDADMVFGEDILDDLTWCEKDFVCGVFHGRRPPHLSCIFQGLDPVERFPEYPEQVFEIAGCGFGCVLIATKILAAVREKFGSCFCPTKELGEDLAFCQRVTECGFKMYCEPTARVGHIGHITIWPEDEERWISKVIKQ